MKRLLILFYFLTIFSFCANAQVTLNQVVLKIDSNNWDTAFVNYTSSLGKVDFIGSTVFFDHTTNCMNVNSGFAFNSKILGSSISYDTTMVLAYPGYETQYFKLNAYWDTSTSSSPPNRIILDAFTYDSCTITKIEETNQHKEVLIYPNPNKGVFKLNNTSNSSIELIVHSLTGKRLKEYQSYQQYYDISDLAKGVYIISIQSEKERFIKKVIIN